MFMYDLCCSVLRGGVFPIIDAWRIVWMKVMGILKIPHSSF